MSTEVRVVYHFEDGSWWADSDDAPGYYAGADTLDQLRERVLEGLEFHFEDSVEVSEEIIEIVTTTTRLGDDTQIEQRVRYRADQGISLASMQSTASVSTPIRPVLGSAASFLPQPSTPPEVAMARY